MVPMVWTGREIILCPHLPTPIKKWRLGTVKGEEKQKRDYFCNVLSSSNCEA